MSRRLKRGLVVLAALALLGAGLATWRLTRGWNELGVKSIVLITLDTVRADRLGCYGGDPVLTPNLDRLAAEGVRFDRCLTTAPITLPAHASILTGTDPVAHGVRINGAAALDPVNPSLAVALKEAGFQTGAFVSAAVLDQRYGLDRGFDEYDDRLVDAAGACDPSRLERRGERTVDAALGFVDRAVFSPFFLWVHLFDPHAPYQAPGPFASRHEDPYDAEVAYTDWCVGRLLAGLAERERLDECLVVVVADHGEGLSDHGESTHTVFVYDSTIRVPLIFWSPGRLPAGHVVDYTTSTISLAPTVLDLLRLERPAGMYGQALAHLVLDQQDDASLSVLAPAVFESEAAAHYYGFAPLVGIDVHGDKLIWAPRPELYRPNSDPGENDNLFARERIEAGRLKECLDRYLHDHRTERSAPQPLDAETQDLLRQLGYVASRDPSRSGGGRDPKDGIHIVEALQQATLLEKDDPARALEAVERLVATEPGIVEAWDVLAELRAGSGDVAGSLEALERAVKLSPRNPDLYTRQGILLLRQGLEERAEERLRAAVSLDPGHVRARVQLGLMLLGEGQLDQARCKFDEVLRDCPGVVAARVGRADCLRGMQNIRLADQDLRVALAEDPRNLGVLMRLIETSLLLMNQEDAVLFYTRAREIDPDLPRPPELVIPEAP